MRNALLRKLSVDVRKTYGAIVLHRVIRFYDSTSSYAYCCIMISSDFKLNNHTTQHRNTNTNKSHKIAEAPHSILNHLN